MAKTHGETGSRLYVIYRNMRKRCHNPKDKEYKNYGARGIVICPAWSDYTGFREWAHSSGYSDNLTIERRNVNGNYEPNNCYWADQSTQASNKRKRSGTINKITGVHPLASGKWRAIVQWKGKKLFDSAIYETPEAALKARNEFIIANKLPHIIQ